MKRNDRRNDKKYTGDMECGIIIPMIGNGRVKQIRNYGRRKCVMKKIDIICGLMFPWILILFGIPVGTYYITNLLIRGIYVFVIIFSSIILFRLALDVWKDKRNK